MAGRLISRRVLFGVAAIGAAAALPEKAASPTDADLVVLGRRLRQLRRRCRRVGRVQGDSHAAWTRWSSERERLDALCEQIARSPVEGLHGLAIRPEALMIEIEDDECRARYNDDAPATGLWPRVARGCSTERDIVLDCERPASSGRLPHGGSLLHAVDDRSSRRQRGRAAYGLSCHSDWPKNRPPLIALVLVVAGWQVGHLDRALRRLNAAGHVATHARAVTGPGQVVRLDFHP